MNLIRSNPMSKILSQAAEHDLAELIELFLTDFNLSTEALFQILIDVEDVEGVEKMLNEYKQKRLVGEAAQ